MCCVISIEYDDDDRDDDADVDGDDDGAECARTEGRYSGSSRPHVLTLPSTQHGASR